MRLRMDHAGRARRRGGLRTRRPRVSFPGSTGSSALAWLALAALGGCQAATPPGTVSSPPERAAAWIVQDGDSVSLVVEIARTATQQERGLAGRGVLESRSGMLFVFDETDRHSFWMKNTFIPLDMVFARRDGRVSSVVRNTEPQSLESISSTEPVSFVLELNAGTTERLSIDVGSRLIWER